MAMDPWTPSTARGAGTEWLYGGAHDPQLALAAGQEIEKKPEPLPAVVVFPLVCLGVTALASVATLIAILVKK